MDKKRKTRNTKYRLCVRIIIDYDNELYCLINYNKKINQKRIRFSKTKKIGSFFFFLLNFYRQTNHEFYL